MTIYGCNIKEAMEGNEMNTFNEMIDILSDTSKYNISKFSDQQIKLLFDKLINWPVELRFPILDLLRMVVTHPDGARRLNSNSNLLTLIIQSGFAQPSSSNQMLALRFIANMFTFDFFVATLKSNIQPVLQLVIECVKMENKNIRIAASTIILNYASVLLTQKDFDKLQLISIISEILKAEQEEEVIYRTLVALGTLCFDDRFALQLVDTFEIWNKINGYKNSSIQRLSAVSNEILRCGKK